jgi:hypothetical protein
MGFESSAVARVRLRSVLDTTPDGALRSTLLELVQGSYVHSKFDKFDEGGGRPETPTAASPAAGGDRLVHDTLSIPTGDAPADRGSAVPVPPAAVGDDPLPPSLQLGADPRPLLAGALSVGDTASELLAAASAQARALSAVWEAHRRGAVVLPTAVADAVCRARECWPAALRPIGGSPPPATAR